LGNYYLKGQCVKEAPPMYTCMFLGHTLTLFLTITSTTGYGLVRVSSLYGLMAWLQPTLSGAFSSKLNTPSLLLYQLSVYLYLYFTPAAKGWFNV